MIGSTLSLPERSRSSAPLPPAVPSSHPLGHLPRLTHDPLGCFIDAHAHAGDVARMRVITGHIVSLSHPEHWHQVLVTHRDRYAKRTRGYDKLKLFLGEGLVTAEGDHWRRQRRIAQPAFHKKHIATFARSMTRACLDLRAEWLASAAAGEVRDVAADMMTLTLRIAGETLFSLDLTGEAAEVGEALGEILVGFDRVTTAPLPFPERWPTADNKRMFAAIGVLDRVVTDIIDRRRADERAGRGVGDDLLGLLMAARDEDGAAMDDKQLRDEVMTMLLAGHETTANALAWTLHLLSTHPHEADAAVAEIRGALGAEVTEDGLGLRQLCQLGQVDRVLQEAMRLYPPVWIIGRRAEQEDEIGGYRIKKGTFVYMPAYVMHRRADLWQRPERFEPARFSKERVAARKALGVHKFAWLPFSGGQRKCIGDQFARMEAAIALAVLLPAVRLHAQAGRTVAPDPRLTLRPLGGLPMGLSLR